MSTTDLDESSLLTILVKRSARLIDRNIERLLKKHGIARSQYRVLYLVTHRGELTQTALAELLEVQGPTLTLIVDALVQKGWLVRVADDADKRVKKLRLTPEGKKVFKQVPDPLETINETIEQTITTAEARRLEVSLKKIISHLNEIGKG